MRVFNRHEVQRGLVISSGVNDLFDVSHVEHAFRVIDGHELHARITRRRAHLEVDQVPVLAQRSQGHRVPARMRTAIWLAMTPEDHEDRRLLAN